MFFILTRFLIAPLLLLSSSQALAQECYDFPNNSQLSPNSFLLNTVNNLSLAIVDRLRAL
jgi:hypothetical protein